VTSGSLPVTSGSLPVTSGSLPVTSVNDLVTAVRRAAERWPDRPAWTFDPGERLSFAEVADRSARIAGALADVGVGAGDRVGVMLGNTPEFPLVWLALARLGAAIVPLSPRYRSADLDHLLRTARCQALVSRPGQWEPLLSLAADVPGADRLIDVASLESAAPTPDQLTPRPAVSLNVQFTSGTTGYPKGCVLSHDYWVTLGRSLVTGFPHLDEHDVMLTAQPFHYVDPQWNVVAGLLAGAHLIVLDGFHPSTFWERVRTHRVTYFYCLASMPTLLLRTPPTSADAHHDVRAVQCSAIPVAQHAELERRWGVRWYEAFGMTETGADLRVTDADHDDLVGSGCVGAPVAHREARVVGEDGSAVAAGTRGELQLRGPGMMDGYFADPKATAAAFDGGWFRTGDLAHLDGDGRVYLDGRIKDMIRRSGENIATREVEEVLTAHPDVALAAVVAVPDDLRGEEVKAIVVAASGCPPSPEALATYCGERLAGFKVPRFWEFRESLPLTPSQRVAKSALGPPVGVVHDVRPGANS
jgi:crotonobetaine/carnitine-CoA ligase